MKIEKISENIIKVTISYNDLEEREIDLNSINYNSPAAQKLFWDMMNQAEEEFGFDVSDAQMLIESIPDSIEGFVITITRLDEDSDFETIHRYIRSRYTNPGAKPKKRNRRIYSATLIYSFDSIDDVCALSRKLSAYTGGSELYECQGAYYVKLTRNNITLKELRNFETEINEYGSKVNNISFFDGFLNEHGIQIIPSDAMQTLNRYF